LLFYQKDFSKPFEKLFDVFTMYSPAKFGYIKLFLKHSARDIHLLQVFAKSENKQKHIIRKSHLDRRFSQPHKKCTMPSEVRTQMADMLDQ